MSNPRGYILYRGPSLLDDKPIVAIATTARTKNRKTGNMIQTWIMRSDIDPVRANRLGHDYSICGSCPHRGIPNKRKGHGYADKRGCYVNLGQAPLQVWKACKKGLYPTNPPIDVFVDRPLRLGSYGDPAAVPDYVWQPLVDVASSWTGYTHQWRMSSASGLKKWLMASVDSPREALQAKVKGWRTFRIGTNRDPSEVLCPANGETITCASCSLCQGISKQAKSIVIEPHGPGAMYVIQ